MTHQTHPRAAVRWAVLDSAHLGVSRLAGVGVAAALNWRYSKTDKSFLFLFFKKEALSFLKKRNKKLSPV